MGKWEERKMDNKPLIKWHAQELHRLLSEDQNDPITVRVLVELETVFFNSRPYKDIIAMPSEHNG